MDNAIKEAIMRKRAKAGMDPAQQVDSEGEQHDEAEHSDLAPDVKNSHVDGTNQNVNPTRPDEAGFSSDPGLNNAEEGRDEHIYPQDDFTDPSKNLRSPNTKNDGRLMAGTGQDPQHDDMGVDSKKQLIEQDTPSNMAGHVSSGALSRRAQGILASKQGVPNLAKGDQPDGPGADAMKTAKAQVADGKMPGNSKIRGGLEGPDANQRYSHKPMAGANAKMRQKY